MDSLSSSLRAIAAELVASRPGLALQIGTAPDDARVLVVRSPTDDRERNIVLWDDDGDLGLMFGPCHTHGNIGYWYGAAADGEAELTAIARAIVDDEIVIATEVGGANDGIGGFLDLRAPDAVLDELTRRWAPNELRIRTWSGRDDRVVSLSDFA